MFKVLNIWATDPNNLSDLCKIHPDRVIDLCEPWTAAPTSGRLYITSSQPQKVVVDFVHHHQNVRGRTIPKVFKLRNVDLATGGHLPITKRHPIRPIRTRHYYSGVHRVEILVNGAVLAEGQFSLAVHVQ